MKNTTRIIAVALLMVMAIAALVSCGSNADSIVGKWEIVEYGQSLAMEFTKDGKINAYYNGKLMGSGEYKVTGNKVANNVSGEWSEYAEFSVKGDELTLTINGNPAVYKKVK